MYKIKLLPITHIDLQKARKWYNKQNLKLGDDLKKEVNKAIDYIGKYPFHFQTKYKEIRVSYTMRFPYGIFYLIKENEKKVVVLGVLHNKQNPDIIKKRSAK